MSFALPDALFSEETRREMAALPPVDVVVGIPTYRNAATVGHVARMVEAGLREYFPDQSALVVLSDGASDDGTVDAALAALSPAGPHRLALSYAGLAGKGSAFRAIFEIVSELKPAAAAVFDADLRSISPGWIERMIRPVLEGAGLITPLYVRDRYDATITNSIAFPLTAALYGLSIRQPIGGDFGFSSELAANWASKDVWDSDVAQFGVDIWMTTVAVCEGFEVAQSQLGAKVHDAKDPATHLGPMFRQVVGSLFALAGKYPQRWLHVEDVRDIAKYGGAMLSAPEPVVIDEPALIDGFHEGVPVFDGLWHEVLTDATYAGVRAAVADGALAADLWVQVVYDYLIAHNGQGVEPGHLMESMIPLYFARTATFVEETRDLDQAATEEQIASYVDLFLSEKDYLLRRWYLQGNAAS